MNKTPILELINIGKSYKEDSNSTKVIEKSSFLIKEGETVSIIGSSGCGKSTILQLCGLLDCQDSGEIYIDGINTTNLNDNQKTDIRKRKIGFIYQMHHLFPEFSVYENVALPLMINEKKIIKDEIFNLLDDLGLKNKANFMPSQLSGGEKQRVAIARAIINKPKIILADEPTGNLDEKNSVNVVELLINTCKSFNLALLMVTHNIGLSKYTQRIITIKDYKILEVKK